MNIQIDTIRKKVILQEEINCLDFFEALSNLLPNDIWKEFTLETNVINNWVNPIVIKEYPVYPTSPNPLPFQPYTPIQPYPAPYPDPINPNPIFPWITCGTSTDSKTGFECSLAPGIFNVEYPKK